MTVQRREHFRIEYPAEERAILFLNRIQFSIIDLSQSGIRFLSPEHLPQMGQIFMIKVIMLHGYQHLTRPKVVRLQNSEVMLVMQQQINRIQIDAEEEYLFQKHGQFRSAPEYY
jgi:c-di-GMP-binding flagellar brake protein YcgR